MIPAGYKAFGVPIVGIPQLKRVTRILTAEEITTLFTTPIALVTGVPGKTLYPELIHYYKEAGTAYGNAGGALALKYSGANNIYTVTASTLFTATFETLLVITPGSLSINSVVRLDSVDRRGLGLDLSLGTANMTPGSGRFFITLFYREWLVAPIG